MKHILIRLRDATLEVLALGAVAFTVLCIIASILLAVKSLVGAP